MRVKTVLVVQKNPLLKSALYGSIRESLKAAGEIFSEEAQRLTLEEEHVVTGRYMRSIGNQHSDDGIFRFAPDGKSYLDVGTNVPYAGYLEGRYSLLARAVDLTAPRAQAKIGVVFNKYLESHS